MPGNALQHQGKLRSCQSCVLSQPNDLAPCRGGAGSAESLRDRQAHERGRETPLVQPWRWWSVCVYSVPQLLRWSTPRHTSRRGRGQLGAAPAAAAVSVGSYSRASLLQPWLHARLGHAAAAPPESRMARRRRRRMRGIAAAGAPPLRSARASMQSAHHSPAGRATRGCSTGARGLPWGATRARGLCRPCA